VIFADKKFESDYPNLSLDQVNDWIVGQNHESFKNLNHGFAFIIFEKNDLSLKISRDLFGLYSIFYTTDNNWAQISNLYSKLISNVNFKPDNNFILNYLNSNFDSQTISEATILENIKRVLPGHEIEFLNKSIFIKPLDHIYSFKKTGINFEQIFRENLAENITIGPEIGTHLSGGLDSGLITLELSQIKKNIHAFLLDTGAENDEDKHNALNIADLFNTNLHILKPSHLTFEVAKQMCLTTGQPELLLFSSHYFLQINEEAKALKLKKILNGHGGDAILGYGFEYLDYLYEKNDFEQLKKSLYQYYEKRASVLKKYFDFDHPKALFQDFFLKKIKFEFNKNGPIKASKKAITIWVYFRLNPIYTITRLIKYLSNYKNKEVKNHAPEINYGDIFLKEGDKYQKQNINANFVALGIFNLETLNALGETQQIDQRYPFLSYKLLENSIYTSLEEKFYEGYGRGIIRNALKKYTKQTIYNRVTKGDFYNFALDSFLNLWSDYQLHFNKDHMVWAYADKKRFENAIIQLTNNKFTSNHNTKELWYCQRVVFLAIWFDVYS
jgi:asparagine synthase (glutamine-hydrolysing)